MIVESLGQAFRRLELHTIEGAACLDARAVLARSVHPDSVEVLERQTERIHDFCDSPRKQLACGAPATGAVSSMPAKFTLGGGSGTS